MKLVHLCTLCIRNQHHMYGLTEETILLQLDVRTSVTVFEQR